MGMGALDKPFVDHHDLAERRRYLESLMARLGGRKGCAWRRAGARRQGDRIAAVDRAAVLGSPWSA